MAIKRIFDLLEQYNEKYPKDDALAVKRNGKWEKFSTKQYYDNVQYACYGLLEMGFKKGDRIASVSNNRPEWNFLDMAIAQLGLVHVPIYPTIGEAEYLHIFSHSQAKILVLGTHELYQRVKPFADKVDNITKVYTFDNIEGASNFQEIIDLGKQNESKHKDEVQKIKQSVKEDDLFSVIYTSGTTGLSKGVMLSHKNFSSNVMASSEVVDLVPEFRALSFLPLCHVLERMVNYLYHEGGVSIYYAESIDTIGDNMKEINPDLFVTVPRVLEKVFDKIYAKGNELTGVKRKLFFWAVDMALKFELNNKNGAVYAQKLKIADKLIFSKWREAIGGNVKYIISGGAALQPRLARVFWAAKIKVLEGYGLTETAPVISVNKPEYPYIQFGTVGPLLKTSEVKIADDGEILFKGPNLMMGYLNDPEKTKEAIDEDGWFHTGDIGELLEHNILKITDRKKEMFKLSTGKYVAPQIVENRFKESPFIEQIMVVGEGEKFAAALISPSFEHLHDWASHNNIHFRDNIELIKNPKVIARYQEEVDTLNKTCDKTRKVKKFELVCEPWATDSGELSPTLKLKRRFVKEKYKVKLDRLYGYTQEEGHVGNVETIEK